MSSGSATGVERSKRYWPFMQILGWIRVLCVTRSMELFATPTLRLVLDLSVRGLNPDVRRNHTF